MTDSTVKRYILALAIQAEIEGMKADNERRAQNGWSLSYGEGHFQEKAEELRQLANTHEEQL